MKSKLAQLYRDNAVSQARQPLRAEVSGDEATVYLYDFITDVHDEYWGGVGADVFVRELKAITAPTIHLRINCPGGDVFAGRAMEAAIREHPSRCIAHVDGYAASAASYVALACDEVEMAAGAFFMIHKAWTVGWGNADDLMHTAALLEKIDASLVQTYAAETGQDAAQIEEWLAAETWFTAEEAVKFGFADRISTGGDKKRSACASWNLSAYAKAPAPVGQEPEEAQSHPQVNNRARYECLARLHGPVSGLRTPAPHSPQP